MSDTRIKDRVLCNPSVKLEKGVSYSFIDMEAITPGIKAVGPVESSEYSGQSCSKFCNGDTLMARITPCLENGKITQYMGKTAKAFGSTEFFVFRGIPKITDNDYVYYLMSTPYIRKSAVNSMTGASGRQRADITFISKIKWDFPSYQEQKRIAEILSVYDNLIEINNKRIKVLEQMAENLYKEWFVHFRFPGHESVPFENGLPKGWRLIKTNNICKITTGKKDANQADVQGKYPFFSCARENDLYSNDPFLSGEAILISGNGSYTGLTKCYRGIFDLYQRTYALYDINVVSWQYLYWSYKLGFEKEYMGGNHGSAIPYITKPDIEKYKIIVPNEAILNSASRYFEDVYNMCDVLRKENENLIMQRDLLLPRLMSGKLEV